MNINRSLFIMSFEITDIDFTVKYKLVFEIFFFVKILRINNF